MDGTGAQTADGTGPTGGASIWFGAEDDRRPWYVRTERGSGHVTGDARRTVGRQGSRWCVHHHCGVMWFLVVDGEAGLRRADPVPPHPHYRNREGQ